MKKHSTTADASQKAAAPAAAERWRVSIKRRGVGWRKFGVYLGRQTAIGRAADCLAAYGDCAGVKVELENPGGKVET